MSKYDFTRTSVSIDPELSSRHEFIELDVFRRSVRMSLGLGFNV